MGVKVGFKALLPLLVIALLFVSIFSPVVEASIAYGPNKFLGDWYLGPKTGIVNGSGSIVNGSKPDNTPRTGNANPSIIYTGQYQFPGNDNRGPDKDSDRGPVFDDYKRLMGRYRPDMSFDNDGNVHFNAKGGRDNVNAKGGRDDAGSSLVFKFLGKYVKTDNFTITAPYGNYTLCLRNGDGTGKYVKNGTIFYVRLNGKDVFTPLDSSLTSQALKKKVAVSVDNTLEVFAVGLPGSYLTLWLEDEQPDIVLTSPASDTVANGPIVLAGYTTDRNVTSIKITQSNNTTVTTVPASNGNFSTSLWISAPVNVTVSAIDSTGTTRSTSLLLDGDYLPTQAELLYGFNPLNPDSDTKLTTENEAGNGVLDGYEILNKPAGENLPCYLKYLVGADPFKVDSNGNGLTDYFELVKLYNLNVSSNSSDEMTLPNEDPENDGLTNIREQALGTEPLIADTDGDSLQDGYEVNVLHTNPLVKDTDADGLDDDSELKVGTDPNNQYSRGDSILDSLGTYTTTASNDTLGITVYINGVGDVSKRTTIVQESSAYYTNNSALRSPLAYVGVNGSFNYTIVMMRYDPAIVSDPANLSLCYYNETYGLFLPVNSTVDPVNHTISANVTHLSLWGIFDLNALSGLYSMVSTFNDEIAGYVSGSASILQNIVDDSLELLKVTKTYTVDPGTNTIVIKDSVTFPNTRTTVLGAPAPTPTPTPNPSPGPLDYSPIVITMNNKGQTNWFGNGASFPSGVFQINATGWYAHWSPVPSGDPECIDLGPDRPVKMYSWSSRGNDYPYANVSDADRLGMHVKYGSKDSPVIALRIEPGTLQFTSDGGQIGLWDNDNDYHDNTYQLTYTLSYVGQSTPTLNLTDTDDDGLPDRLETHGWMDTQGNVYTTKPDSFDSDGDDLTDGQEANTWVQLYQMKYFQVKSNPGKVDSDNDGLDDPDENDIGTKAFNDDTDLDGLKDGEEVNGWIDPLVLAYGVKSTNYVYFGTNPTDPDTDHDSYNDYAETKGSFYYEFIYNPNGTLKYQKIVYTYDPVYTEGYTHDFMTLYFTGVWEGYKPDSVYATDANYIAGCEIHDYEVEQGYAFIYTGMMILPFLEIISIESRINIMETEAADEIGIIRTIEEGSTGELHDAALAIAEQSGTIRNEGELAGFLRTELQAQDENGVKYNAYDDLCLAGMKTGNVGKLTTTLGKDRVIRLDQIIKDYKVDPKYVRFLDEQIGQNIEEGSTVRTTVTVNLKEMTEPGKSDSEIRGYLNNIEGGYREWQTSMRIKDDGQMVIRLHHINANGEDIGQVVNKDNSLTLFQVKPDTATIADVEKGAFYMKDGKGNFIVDSVTGQKYYNANRAINQIKNNLKQDDMEAGRPMADDSEYRARAEAIWESHPKVIQFDVYGSDSGDCCSGLQQRLGNTIEYKYTSIVDGNTEKIDTATIKYNPIND